MMIVVLHMRGIVDAPWLTLAPASLVQGVSFFFVLSGFILTHVYHAEGRLQLGPFMVSRLARLYPTHVAALLFVIVAIPWSQIAFAGAGPGMTAASFLLKLMMLDSWAPIPSIQFGANGVSWSLSTEMFFYLAFPFLLTGFAGAWPRRLMLAALCPVAIYAVGGWLGAPIAGAGSNGVSLAQLGFSNPVARIFEFTLGMSCYLAWARWVEPLALSWGAWTAIECAIVATLMAWLGFGVEAVQAHLSIPTLWLWFNSSGSCGLFAALIVVFASARGALGALLARPAMVWLGQISFAVYMFHQIAIRALSVVLTRLFGADIGSLVVIGAIIAIAAANHRWVEAPGRRLVFAIAARFGGSRTKSALAGA
jgi:peptidoglycan/LPS O-acetylase OafA/YrhL